LKIKEQGNLNSDLKNTTESEFKPTKNMKSNDITKILLLGGAILCEILVLVYFLFFKTKDEIVITEVKKDTSTSNSDKFKSRELELKEKELELKERELVQQKEISDKLLKEKNRTSNNSNNGSSGYSPGIFPQASDRYLSNSDVYALSQWDLKIMRNEIFARHGYIFQTDEMRDYFSNKSWYNPRFYDVNNMLSKIEKENVALIKNMNAEI